jgi:putative transposase
LPLSNRAPPEDIERDYYRKLERYLDPGCGECWLRRPDIAEVFANALRFFVGERYQLSAWVVMPNHVHAVV